MRASDPRIVLGDGRAAHMGTGRTGLRSLQRQPGPNRTDRPPRPTSLQGIAQKAERQQGDRFRNLYGRLSEDVLKQGGRDIRKEAAAGVEQGRAQADEPHRDENLHHRVARRKQKRYRRHTRQTTRYAPRGWHTASSGNPSRGRYAPATSRGAPPRSPRRAGAVAMGIVRRWGPWRRWIH